jgi:hypothetical protein
MLVTVIVCVRGRVRVRVCGQTVVCGRTCVRFASAVFL